ncbi:hypothetical protein ABK040_015221 [Willaertia magna]
MSLFDIDDNLFCFIIFNYLDDRSLIELSLTCKTFYKLIEGNEEFNFWKIKFNNYLNLFLQNNVIPLSHKSTNNNVHSNKEPKLSLTEENKLTLINERISKFLNVYKNKMFQNLNELNIDKIKYILLKHKYIFLKPNKEINIYPNQIYPYYNDFHTLASLDQKFWRTFYSKIILKPKNIYHCCILLSYFNQEEERYDNSWQILIGIETNINKPFIETLLSFNSGKHNNNEERKYEDFGFGYCVKSDALIENGCTSYNVKTVNNGGDCIGVKIDFMKEGEASLTFYLKNGEERNYKKKVNSKKEYQFVVSLVRSKQLITLFPWDGNVENLKY